MARILFHFQSHRRPDIFYIPHERRHIVLDRVYGAPSVVIEVLSPSLRIGNLDERIRWFTEYGVQECWLVHQMSREIEVLDLAVGRVLSRRRAGPDQRVPSEYFAEFPHTLHDILAS